MHPFPKFRLIRDRDVRRRLSDTLGVISLFVLLGCALHLPLLA
jgi:hypothetical protein